MGRLSAILFLTAAGGAGWIWIGHLFRTVVVCGLGSDHRILGIRAFSATCGFPVASNEGLRVTLHEHPGTDLFCDRVLQVTGDAGRLGFEEIESRCRSRRSG